MEIKVRFWDELSFNQAMMGNQATGRITLAHLAPWDQKGLRFGATPALVSQDARELNSLVDALGGKCRFDGMFDGMPEGDLGFVTNRVANVAFPEHDNPDQHRFWLASGGSSLVVQSPNVHVYMNGEVDYVALVYTVDNGALWVTRARGCGDELGMLAWATATIGSVKKQLQTIAGDEKRTAAIADWQTVSFPLVAGAHWQAPAWMQDVKATTDDGFVRVAGMVQRLELSFALEGALQAPQTLLASGNHMTFDGDVLVFKTRPSNDDGGDPFCIEWLCALDGVKAVA